MKKQFPLEQSEELEAVVSCFGEEFMSVDWSGDELKGVISVVLEPRLQPIVISATDGKDYRQFETKQLSPVDLHFNLPVEYPAKQAMIDVDCMWMPTSMRSTMLKRLGDVVSENLGSPILFLCCEDVKKFVESTEIAELRLEGNHFARKNKLRPMEVLDLVRNECEKAEELEFEGHCHDCNVCFENKLGRECVRFSPCGHTFCRECVTAYFNERLTAQEVSPLTCLSDGCESSVPQKLIIELLGQEAFDRYERILLSRVLDTMDDLAVCPRVACQKPAALSQATENLGTCLICGYSFCTKCRRTFHGVQPCRSKFDISVSALVENEDGTWGLREVSLQEYLRATPEERIEMGWWYGGIENLEAEMEEAMIKADGHSHLWIQENSKKCPKCSIPIQKTEGCNKMTCAVCKTYFCWLCEEQLNQKDPYSHFQYGACRDQLFDVPEEPDDGDDGEEGEGH